MANPEHLAILKRGWREWNRWREENPDIRPDLSDAYLTSAEVPSAHLRCMDLSNTDFRRVYFILRNLHGVNLAGANLDEARFDGADLEEANLTQASLVAANLNGANLSGAFLEKAKLRKADLRGTRFLGAHCEQIDLRGAMLTFSALVSANLKRARLGGANLYGTNLTSADLSNADLKQADLSSTVLVHSNFEKANIAGCRVYGISAWDIRASDSIQRDLIITPEGEPEITVDNLKVAQFIYLLLNNAEIRDVIDTVARKAILILGRFGEHKLVLDAIRKELRKFDYLPVLFDFKPPLTRNVRETVRTLAHLSRFIIADVTDPSSIPLELETIIPELRVPVQPLLLTTHKEFSMFQDLREAYHWVLATHQYTDIDDLLASLGDKVIAPAEQKARELEKR